MSLVKQDVRSPCPVCKCEFLRVTIYTGKFDGRRSERYSVVAVVDWCRWCDYRYKYIRTTRNDDRMFRSRCVCDCEEIRGWFNCEKVKKFLRSVER